MMWLEAIGWFGTCMVLCAYALLSAKKLAPTGYIYQGLNISGALLLAYYTWEKDAIPSSFLNIIWCLIGLATIITAYRQHKRR